MCHAHYHICTHSLFLSHFRQTMPSCIPYIQNANLADDTLLFAKTEAARWWLWTENLKRNQINKLKAWTRKKTKTPAGLWRESLSLYSGKKIRYFSGKLIKDSNALLCGSICAAPFFFCFVVWVFYIVAFGNVQLWKKATFKRVIQRWTMKHFQQHHQQQQQKYNCTDETTTLSLFVLFCL